jgi:Rps23 Pro-64 3,4-dihydroxylase Tpa1-like proline 4-hydroxylase
VHNVEVQIIRGAVLQQTQDLANQFVAGCPFRHAVIDQFLEEKVCGQLREQFPEFSAERARNELGEVGRKAVVPELASIGPAYAVLDELLRSRTFRDWLGRVAGIGSLLYDPAYVGGGTHENLDGQDLDPHIDFNYHPASGLHRRLNLILFLNPEWEEGWGGLLELHSNPWAVAGTDEIKRILPSWNRCVIFETTERSWHGFRRIRLPADKQHLSRRSIAVYYYTRQRPRLEAAASHGTVYVPRGLAEHIQPGHTLSGEDVQEIQLLLARRDRQIQYLYEREMQYARIAQSPTVRLARALVWPARKLLRRK